MVIYRMNLNNLNLAFNGIFFKLDTVYQFRNKVSKIANLTDRIKKYIKEFCSELWNFLVVKRIWEYRISSKKFSRKISIISF